VSLFRLEPVPEPGLDAPVLLAAFDGWVDAASAATSAAEHLARGGELVAEFNGDVLFDYRSRRPVLDIIDGTLARLEWPALALHRTRVDGRDVLVLHGAEPDFRWQELGDDMLQLCLRLGVVEWVSVGAIPAAVPHTRPVPVLATASDDADLRHGEKKGPPGLLRVPSACLSSLEMAVQNAGIPAVGFFAQVPHYVGGPYAAASVSLLEHVGRHLGVELPLGALAEDAVSQRSRLDAAVEADEDVRDILQRMESSSDEAQAMPSGDDLAAEIERFLRDQPDEGPAGPGAQGPFPGT
jgi:hypothetical protein